jgi:hypothetical protein
MQRTRRIERGAATTKETIQLAHVKHALLHLQELLLCNQNYGWWKSAVETVGIGT